MLSDAWLLITFILLLAAVLLRQAPLLLVALLFFLASGVARLWARYALEGVEYRRRLSSNRVFFGETITLDISIDNRKILPLPWIHIEDELPKEVTLPKGKVSPSYMPNRSILLDFLSLSWYHRVTRRYPVQCLRRGHFSFGPVTLRSGDLFGLFRKETTEKKLDYLMVYPSVVPLENLGILSREPFGDLRVRRHLFEDPIRVVSTRDYACGDPLKRIHWKASARLQRLQSRVFEQTTTMDLALFLDTRTEEPPLWGHSEQLLETAAIVAASIASYAMREGYRVGLYVNEPLYSGYMIKLPPSDHPNQLQRVLEALAQIQGWPLIPLEQLLNREGHSLPWGATLTVVTAIPTEPLLASLNRFRRAGRRLALILIGGKARHFRLDGLPTYHVSDQVYWRELESVRVGAVVQG